jgi:hypothetical protein
MEFPEDILTIIRSFARPRMRFIHEYNEIVRALGTEWPAVKVKLATSNAAQVLSYFASYADAVLIAREANDAVPILPQDYTCVERRKWLFASRVFRMHLDVSNERFKRLTYLL